MTLNINLQITKLLLFLSKSGTLIPKKSCIKYTKKMQKYKT